MKTVTTTLDDLSLLKAYVCNGEQDAFTQLVKRHSSLVYSAALRQTASHERAQEVTQAVFILLARKAASIRSQSHLIGFLLKTTRYAALDAMKHQSRYESRISQFAGQCTVPAGPEKESDETWFQVQPLLDEALAALSPRDQAAVATRYFQSRSLREVAQVLVCSEEAAKKRVLRALEKLRSFFQSRGVVLSASGLGELIASHGLETVSPDLATAIASGALKAGGLSSGTILLVEATAKTITLAKLQTLGIGLAASLVLVVGSIALMPRSKPSAAPIGANGKSQAQTTQLLAKPASSGNESSGQTVRTELAKAGPAEPKPIYPLPPRTVTAKPTALPSSAPPEPSASGVEARLRSLVIDKMEFREASWEQSVAFLEQKTQKIDPSGVGIQIFGAVADPKARITVSLSNIPVVDAIKYVTSLFGLEFRVTEVGVEIMNLRPPSKNGLMLDSAANGDANSMKQAEESKAFR